MDFLKGGKCKWFIRTSNDRYRLPPRFHYTIALTCIYGKESEWVWYASGIFFVDERDIQLVISVLMIMQNWLNTWTEMIGLVTTTDYRVNKILHMFYWNWHNVICRYRNPNF